jgi:hypothetical protein
VVLLAAEINDFGMDFRFEAGYGPIATVMEIVMNEKEPPADRQRLSHQTVAGLSLSAGGKPGRPPAYRRAGLVKAQPISLGRTILAARHRRNGVRSIVQRITQRRRQQRNPPGSHNRQQSQGQRSRSAAATKSTGAEWQRLYLRNIGLRGCPKAQRTSAR